MSAPGPCIAGCPSCGRVRFYQENPGLVRCFGAPGSLGHPGMPMTLIHADRWTTFSSEDERATNGYRIGGGSATY